MEIGTISLTIGQAVLSEATKSYSVTNPYVQLRCRQIFHKTTNRVPPLTTGTSVANKGFDETFRLQVLSRDDEVAIQLIDGDRQRENFDGSQVGETVVKLGDLMDRADHWLKLYFEPKDGMGKIEGALLFVQAHFIKRGHAGGEYFETVDKETLWRHVAKQERYVTE